MDKPVTPLACVLLLALALAPALGADGGPTDVAAMPSAQPTASTAPAPATADLDLPTLAFSTASESRAPSCGSYIRSEPCQTGGWWQGSCTRCVYAPCYFRWEGTLEHYQGGTKAGNFKKVERCSRPPSMATCNTTC